MTQHRSQNRASRHLVDLDARYRDRLRRGRALAPVDTIPTDPADGTLLDVVPLPDTGKVLMIVAHVVPASAALPASPPEDSEDETPAEPRPLADNAVGDPHVAGPHDPAPQAPTRSPASTSTSIATTNDRPRHDATPLTGVRRPPARPADTPAPSGAAGQATAALPDPAGRSITSPPSIEQDIATSGRPAPSFPSPDPAGITAPGRPAPSFPSTDPADITMPGRPAQSSASPDPTDIATPGRPAPSFPLGDPTDIATPGHPGESCAPPGPAGQAVVSSNSAGPGISVPGQAGQYGGSSNPGRPDEANWSRAGQDLTSRTRAGQDDPAPATRGDAAGDDEARADALRVDEPSRRVWVDGQEIGLTYQEFELLVHFMTHPWKVFSRAQLMQALWPAVDAATRTVDVHVHRLRRKLGRAGDQLATVRRVGYVYRPQLANRSELTHTGE